MGKVATLREKKLWRVGTLTYTTGGLVLLCLWLLWGDFPWAMKARAISPSSTLLIKQLGVSDFLYGLIIIAFPNFTNIFLMPTIAYLSDRHRGRYGRRIPFLLFTTPFIVVGIYLLGLTHPLGGWLSTSIPGLSEHVAKLSVFCLGWVMLDFGTTLSASLYNALVNDVMPREVLGRFFALCRMVSLAAGMLFNWCLIGKVESHSTAILIGVGTLYGVGLLSMCWRVKEGEYPPPEKDREFSSGSGDGLKTVLKRVIQSGANYLRQSFAHPYYRWYMVAHAMGALAFSPLNSFAIQYAKSLGISMDRYGIYLVITFCLSFAASFVLGSLSDRFHPVRTGLAVLSIYTILMFVGFFLAAETTRWGILFVSHCFVSGSYATLNASLGARLLPRNLFAQFTSASAIVGAALSMLMGPMIGKTLDVLNDYRYVFIIGGFIALFSAVLYFKIYRNYLQQGGDAGYCPPDPEQS